MTQNDLADFQHENGIIPLKSADYLERAWKFRTFALSEEEDHSNPFGSEKYLSGAPKNFFLPKAQKSEAQIRQAWINQPLTLTN